MWHGRYISKGGCFVGVLRVNHKHFESASMSFYERSQNDSTVSVLCFKSVLGWFCKNKKGYFCVQKPGQLPMQTQLDRKTLRIPFAHPSYIKELHWNTLEIIWKYPWNTHEIAWKHPWNTQETPS